MRARFDHCETESATISSFFFRPDRPLVYEAGQFIELSLPGDHKHWFTLSTAPEAALPGITTRLDTASPYKQALQKLQPGEPVTLSSAMGDFVLPKDPDRPLIFIAGGIGVTPFHSIFGHLAGTRQTRPIQFIWAVDREQDIIFQDSLARAGIHATIIVNRPSAAWGGERGRLDASKIIGLAQPTAESLVYIAGPETLVESLRGELIGHGLSADQLVSDAFTG